MADADENSRTRELGPEVYQIWHAQQSGVPMPYAYEYPLFTDADVTGGIMEGLGPYQLLNGLAFSEDTSLRAGIILRAEVPAYTSQLDQEWVTDTARYHGGDLSDEVAALISLSLGIRVKAGAAGREFRAGDDPRGRPIGYLSSPNPILLRRYKKAFVLPQSVGEHHLNDMVLLPTLPWLKAEDATALVIAARSYQNAMWVAESEPELSWLLMVSAIETAALHWSKSDEEPADKLQASKPQLYELLFAQGGKALVEQVAIIISDSLGVTSKFIRFTMAYLPDPPPNRPPEWCQLKWSRTTIRNALGKVYNYRSQALHAGRPFPWPMCDYPRVAPETHSYNEVPMGIATSTFGATWRHEDTPMLLHTFEYIVRNVLLSWWRSMLPSTDVNKDSIEGEK